MYYSSQHIPTLRICGLSNPIHASNRAEKAFGLQENHLLKIVKRYSNEAYAVLGGKKAEYISSFCDTCILLPSGFDLGNGIFHQQDSLFTQRFFGYFFRHFFLTKNQYRGPYMSCIEIDEKAIRETQEILGEREFKRLEKALGLLMSCMNHDATTHKYGVIAGGNKMDKLNDFLKKNLGFEKDIPKNKAGNDVSLPGEIAAAAFHRDMFEEIDELGHPKLQLKKMIVEHASIVLQSLSSIQDEKLKGYWISVLKYPLFSLLSPEGAYCDTIRHNYPELNVSPTQWGKVIHRKINKCSVTYKSEEIIEVTLRDIRKLMMRYYQSQNTRIDTPLAKLIAKNASYPPPEDWEHLERMVRAKSFELPMNASDKLIEFHESYRFFTQRFTFAEYGNILFDYEKYLEFKKYGFDVTPWDNKEKWEHAFRKEIERKIEAYEKNGLDIDEAQEISEFFFLLQERYGFGLQERDFPEFIKSRVCRLSMILHSMKENGRKVGFVSSLSLRDEFEHLQQLGIIEKELEELYNSVDITSSVDEEERVPF